MSTVLSLANWRKVRLLTASLPRFSLDAQKLLLGFIHFVSSLRGNFRIRRMSHSASFPDHEVPSPSPVAAAMAADPVADFLQDLPFRSPSWTKDQPPAHRRPAACGDCEWRMLLLAGDVVTGQQKEPWTIFFIHGSMGNMQQFEVRGGRGRDSGSPDLSQGQIVEYSKTCRVIAFDAFGCG